MRNELNRLSTSVNLNKQSLNAIRQSIIDEILDALPKTSKDSISDVSLPYIDPIKYIEGRTANEGTIVYYSGKYGNLRPDSVENLPLDALVTLRDILNSKEYLKGDGTKANAY
jgi:hypothetical protein